MNETNRRRAERHKETFLVSLVLKEAVELHGKTVNWNSNGVLMEASGRISVQVNIKGHTYHGQLVRALPADSGTTVYGIELLDDLWR